MKEDIKLYNEFKNGNKDAFDILINKYRMDIIYFIFKYVRNINVAEDIMQDVTLYILENTDYYSEKFSFKTYLFVLAKSKSLNYLKHEKIENKVELYENIYDTKEIEDNIFDNESKRKIKQIIETLPTDYQLVIYLTKIEKFTYKETAKIMEKTEEQIRKLSYNARLKLKKELITNNIIKISKDNRIKLLLAIVCLIISIPIIGIASKQLLMRDDDGVVMIYSYEEKPDVPDDTPIAIIAPGEEYYEKQAEEFNKKALEDKKIFDNSNDELLNDGYQEISPEEDEMIKRYEDEAIRRENTAKEILSKHYDKKYIDTLFEELANYIEENPSHNFNEYVIPDSGVKLIEMMIELIDINQDETESKNLIKYLKDIEPSGIKNNDYLKNRMIELHDIEEEE